jgi:hypothetical protein
MWLCRVNRAEAKVDRLLSHERKYNKGVTVTATCNHCGASVDPSRDEPCSHCGEYAGKSIQAAITDNIGVQDEVSWARVREFLQYNLWWALVLAVIVLISPFVGLLIAGTLGLIIGLLLSVLSVPVGVFAVTRVREITRGGDR